jgi:hypothetical protein
LFKQFSVYNKIDSNVANEAELQITEKCDPTPESVELNDYNLNSSSYIDPYYWSSDVHNNFLQFCIDKGPEFFQNKNNNFNQSACCDGKL